LNDGSPEYLKRDTIIPTRKRNDRVATLKAPLFVLFGG
jgi:hypothetical protein